MGGDHTLALEDYWPCSLLWAPFPSNGGVDFFQKSLGDPFPTSGRYIFFENGR